MRVDIITIFPEYFAPLRVSLIGKAAQRGDIEFGVHDLRTWAHDPHHSVDDAPFGGGPGMVMKPEPWGEAIDAVVPASAAARLVLPSPAGVPFTQELAARYALESHLVFACGRYEGIDARVAEEARARMPVDEVTIGDYVLAGGEPAVLVMIEAVCRLLPGVIGNAGSAPDDSFGGGDGGCAADRRRHSRDGRRSGARSASPAITATYRPHADSSLCRTKRKLKERKKGSSTEPKSRSCGSDEFGRVSNLSNSRWVLAAVHCGRF